MWGNLWDVIEKNRYTVIMPLVCMALWLCAVGCTPTTLSPVDSTRLVNAAVLETEYQVWVKQNEAVQLRFEASGEDLKRQAEQQEQFKQIITRLATGQVADIGGLAQLLIGGGFAGAFFDNVRKNGVIAGLKRNKKA